ncbi:MAG: hypothetical protein MZV70_08485 [Desulfobacterales bacterium]|nr:hypothetical protein [Desulfobacterales bacterium]
MSSGRVELQTVSSRGKDAAGERHVTLTLDVQLVAPDGKVAWAANGLSDSEAYVGYRTTRFLNDEQAAGRPLGIVADPHRRKDLQPFHR